jgi:hypothetical protein
MAVRFKKRKFAGAKGRFSGKPGGRFTSASRLFHDVKEVHGAGQEQLRNYHANLATWNLCLWLSTLVELWAWDKPKEAICDRSDLPWDNPDRRPSHADRLRALRQGILRQEYSQATAAVRPPPKIRRLLEHLLNMAT